MTLEIVQAVTEEDIASVKRLFQDYVNWMPIDLGFQGIQKEMATFPDKYVLLLLAKLDSRPIGAVGLIPHTEGACEMKRLFVAPGVQSKGTGRALCEALLKEAKNLGYHTMVLDTLTRLKPAVALYQRLGFTEIEPYNVNPEADVTYMSKKL